MVRHIILWTLKDQLSPDEKTKVKIEAKKNLELLKGQIDGLIDIKVHICGLQTSNCDMMLESSFKSFEALKAYSINEKHQNTANTYVRPFTQSRSCLDFEE